MRFIKPQKSGVELPALSAPAVAGDIANGKEAIDGSGNKITGDVFTVESDNAVPAASTLTVADGAAQMEYLFTENDGSVMFRPNSSIGLHCDASELGDAAAGDVVAGKTFTSANGKAVSGNVAEVAAGEVVLKTVTKTLENNLSLQQSAPVSADTLLRAGAIMRLSMPFTSYGDATAADVASGKTFTGADGYKRTGTAPQIGRNWVGTATTKSEIVTKNMSTTAPYKISDFDNYWTSHPFQAGDMFVFRDCTAVGVVYSTTNMFIIACNNTSLGIRIPAGAVVDVYR